MIFKVGPLPMTVGVITTLHGLHGDVVNAAPVTWFTPVSYEPPLMLIALKREKDSKKNIEEMGEFVLQTVPFDCIQKVHNLARGLPRNESEVEYEGLEVVKSKHVHVPRLKIALQWFECIVNPMTIHTWGLTHAQIIGRVLNADEEEVSRLKLSDEDEEHVAMYFGGLNYARPHRSIAVKPY